MQLVFHRLRCKFLLLLLSVFAVNASAQIEADAISVLKQLNETMSNAKAMEFSMIMGYEVVQDDGQKIEFGAIRHIALSRPDKLAITFTSREGKKGEVKFTGKDIYTYNQQENVYAQTEQVGNIGESIEYLTSVLSFPVPVKELFTDNVAKTLSENLTSAYVVGKSTIAGVESFHLAMRSEHVDYQLWVSTAAPYLIQRMVISYRDELGKPQFWANMINWKLNTNISPDKFKISPPSDAERIVIVVDEEHLDDELVDEEH